MEQKERAGHRPRWMRRTDQPMVLKAPWVALAGECVSRFCIAAVLAAGKILGGYSPFALGFVAASGAGAGGFFALLGGAIGYLLTQPLADGFRYVATVVLVYAASFAFYDLKVFQFRYFMPLCAVGMGAMTGFVYLAEQRWQIVSVICYVTELALIFLFSRAYAVCLHREGNQALQRCCWLLGLGSVTISLCGVHLPFGLSLGGAFAVACVVGLSRRGEFLPPTAAGLCLGLCVDLARGGGALYAGALGVGGLLAAMGGRWGRHSGVIGMVAGILSVTLWSYSTVQELSPIWCGVLGCCVYLALPMKWLERLERVLPEETAAPVPAAAPLPGVDLCRDKLRSQSAAFRTLFEQLTSQMEGGKEPGVDYPALFRRCAGRTCQGCGAYSLCWQRELSTTQEMLRPVGERLERHGKVKPEEFPTRFSERCNRLNEWVNAVNAEAAFETTRRRYRRQLKEGRKNLCRQYEVLSRLLEESSLALEPEAVPAMQTPRLSALAGVAAGKRSGQSVSGDAGGWFRDERGMLWVVLCDGMGSGPEAARDSRFAYHLVENLISAGITPETALGTVATALGLRWEDNGSFTTIDLLQLDLNTGEGAVYKLGAAPTYLRREGSLRCITSGTLPAGLNQGAPDVSRFQLKAGDLAVLVSDGVTDGTRDEWVREQIRSFTGNSPKDLAAALLCHENPVSDDRTAIVLLLEEQGKKAV